MKTMFLALTVVTAILFVSCKKDDPGAGSTPTPPPDLSDFTFPASGTASATLYAPTTSVAVNQEFDVRFVLYNVTDVFGTATEITFPADKVQITADAINSAVFSPAASTLVVRGTPPGVTGAYAYGVTYISGSGGSQNGSGVVMKLRFKAIASGSATFSLTKFDLKRSDGTAISIPVQSTAVTIQ